MKQSNYKNNINKKLQYNKIDILNKINNQLVRGDITAISKKIGLTKEYVGLVLNPANGHYNVNIVKEAVRIIEFREMETNKLLQRLPTQNLMGTQT